MRLTSCDISTPLLRGVAQLGVLVLCILGAPSGAYGQTPNPTPVARAQRLMADKQFGATAVLLDSLVASGPQNGQVWLLLGAARRALGLPDSAQAAYQHALEFPRARPQAVMALFLINAGSGRTDDAFGFLDEIRRKGSIDLTTLALNPEIEKLRGDPRFGMFFPDAKTFDHPFVEGWKVLHEWRGSARGDEFGWIARAVGDVDRDRVTDIAVSATMTAPLGNGNGRVLVYSGRTGKQLWVRNGLTGAQLGTGLEAAGDVNHDGIPDVVAGAPGLNTVFVFSGKDGRDLLQLRGDSIDVNLGTSAAGIGDINHDGYADIIAGAPGSGAHGAGAGRAYVFSGRDGARLATFDGEQPGDGLGSAVAGSGGRMFVITAGTGGNDKHGRLYAYRQLAGPPLFVANADSTGAAFGALFASILGDVDGDHVADVYVSDFANAAKGMSTGRAYVLSGKNGAPLLTLTGESAGVGFGIGAARLGDINHDGHDDLILGAWQQSDVAWSGGRVTIHSGKDGRILHTITGRVPGETLGFDAVGVGDTNGDGVTDYLVTSAWSMVSGLRSGRVFLLSGASIGQTR